MSGKLPSFGLGANNNKNRALPSFGNFRQPNNNNHSNQHQYGSNTYHSNNINSSNNNQSQYDHSNNINNNATIPLPFDQFNPQNLPNITKPPNASLIDEYSSSSDDSTDSSDSDSDDDNESTSGFTVTRFNFNNNTTTQQQPTNPITTNQPIPQEQSKPSTTPFADTLGDLKHQLDPKLLSRLPKDTSQSSWEEWLAERRKRFPRIKRTDTTHVESTSTNTNTPQDTNNEDKAKEIKNNLMLDDYSDSDDDTPAVEQKLTKSVPVTISTSDLNSTDSFLNELHISQFDKERHEEILKERRAKVDKEFREIIDRIHLPEYNTIEVNNTILNTRYSEYLTLLGLHSSVVYLLASYPPTKLPLFKTFQSKFPKDGQNNNNPKNDKFNKNKDKFNKHSNKNDTQQNQTTPETFEDIGLSSFPRRKEVDLLKCTTVDNPFVPLCLTLHAQYGYQQYQLYRPTQQYPQYQSQNTNHSTNKTTNDNDNVNKTHQLQTPAPLPIETILNKCHKRIAEGDFSQHLPQSTQKKSFQNKFSQFKQKRNDYLANGRNCNNNGEDGMSKTPQIAYIDLYKKLVSKDLALEHALIMKAFTSMTRNAFFAPSAYGAQQPGGNVENMGEQ